MFADFLIARFNVAFNHNTLNHLVNFRGELAVMHHFFDDTDLLEVFFIGVRVVCIYDSSWILKVTFIIHFNQTHNIFVVVVLCAVTMFAYSTTENNVS